MPQKLTVFYEKRAVLHSASLFVFPKSTRCQTGLLPLSFTICEDLVYSREFLLKSFVPGDFLTFICFYAAEVKESHVVSFVFFFFNPIEITKT